MDQFTGIRPVEQGRRVAVGVVGGLVGEAVRARTRTSRHHGLGGHKGRNSTAPVEFEAAYYGSSESESLVALETI